MAGDANVAGAGRTWRFTTKNFEAGAATIQTRISLPCVRDAIQTRTVVLTKAHFSPAESRNADELKHTPVSAWIEVSAPPGLANPEQRVGQHAELRLRLPLDNRLELP
jgi:hypothetical protein